MKVNEIKSLQEATFKYPEKETNELKERDVFVIGVDQTDVFSISLHEMTEEEKVELFDAAEKLNAIISKHSKGKFRRFKKEKIVE